MVDAVLIITKSGAGKIVNAEDYPTRGRGGKGVKTFKELGCGDDIAVVQHVKTGVGQRVLIATAKGMALMTEVDGATTRSRTAGGVKLIDLAEGDSVVGAAIF